MRGIKTNIALIEYCQSLRSQGFSIDFICQKSGLSKSTVHTYIRDIVLKKDQKKILQQHSIVATIESNQKRKGISRPWNRLSNIPTFSKCLVRCLAHFLFDGSLIGHQACYYNRSQYLVNRHYNDVQQLFGLKGKLVVQKTGVIRLIYNSVELVSCLHRLHQQLLILLSGMPREWKRVFIQAFFDDEGCIYLSSDRKRWRLSGSQKKVDILLAVQRLLEEFDIPSRIVYYPTRVSALVILGGRNSLEKFEKEINFAKNVTMNPLRKNARYGYAIEKRQLVRLAIENYCHKSNKFKKERTDQLHA